MNYHTYLTDLIKSLVVWVWHNRIIQTFIFRILQTEVFLCEDEIPIYSYSKTFFERPLNFLTKLAVKGRWSYKGKVK